jgi:hypothetical protein
MSDPAELGASKKIALCRLLDHPPHPLFTDLCFSCYGELMIVTMDLMVLVYKAMGVDIPAFIRHLISN